MVGAAGNRAAGDAVSRITGLAGAGVASNGVGTIGIGVAIVGTSSTFVHIILTGKSRVSGASAVADVARARVGALPPILAGSDIAWSCRWWDGCGRYWGWRGRRWWDGRGGDGGRGHRRRWDGCGRHGCGRRWSGRDGGRGRPDEGVSASSADAASHIGCDTVVGIAITVARAVGASRSIPRTTVSRPIAIVPALGFVDALAVRVVGAVTVRLTTEGIFIGVADPIATKSATRDDSVDTADASVAGVRCTRVSIIALRIIVANLRWNFARRNDARSSSANMSVHLLGNSLRIDGKSVAHWKLVAPNPCVRTGPITAKSGGKITA